jgi:hypothetical protein
MKKSISALVMFGACVGTCLSLGAPAFAQTDAAKKTATAKAAAKPAAKPAVKKAATKPAPKSRAQLAREKAAADKEKAAMAAGAAAVGIDANEDDDKAPDLANLTTIDYECALGDKVTLYENAVDGKHIGLRWKTGVHRLTRVTTTTGANRFENRKQGLVWIGIPAKGMLLDSKKGQQLANECRNAEQMKPAAAPAVTATSS